MYLTLLLLFYLFYYFDKLIYDFWRVKFFINNTIFDNQANGLACQGKYTAGSIPSFAGNASLFVKAHAY